MRSEREARAPTPLHCARARTSRATDASSRGMPVEKAKFSERCDDASSSARSTVRYLPPPNTARRLGGARYLKRRRSSRSARLASRGFQRLASRERCFAPLGRAELKIREPLHREARAWEAEGSSPLRSAYVKWRLARRSGWSARRRAYSSSSSPHVPLRWSSR